MGFDPDHTGQLVGVEFWYYPKWLDIESYDCIYESVCGCVPCLRYRRKGRKPRVFHIIIKGFMSKILFSECQLGTSRNQVFGNDSFKSKSNLMTAMDQLNQWKHYAHPFPVEVLSVSNILKFLY